MNDDEQRRRPGVTCPRGHRNESTATLCVSCGAVLKPWSPPEAPMSAEADIVPQGSGGLDDVEPQATGLGKVRRRLALIDRLGHHRD